MAQKLQKNNRKVWEAGGNIQSPNNNSMHNNTLKIWNLEMSSKNMIGYLSGNGVYGVDLK